jgi:hypothetical protein
LSSPDQRGRRDAEIVGTASPGVVEQLSELVDNDDRKQSVDDATGVLEQVHFGTSSVPSGHYLLIRCTPERPGLERDGLSAFTLAVRYLGPDPELVVAITTQQRANDFGIVGQPIVWDPTPVVTTDGSEPVSDGTTIFREFDPRLAGDGPVAAGLRHFLRGYVLPASPSVIGNQLPRQELPTARSLLQVGAETGQVVVTVFCGHSRDRGHAAASALAMVTDTERYGLVFSARLDALRTAGDAARRQAIQDARSRRGGRRVSKPFEEHVVVLLEQPVVIEPEGQVTDGGPPRVQCPDGVTTLDADVLKELGLKARSTGRQEQFTLRHKA